jgi:hypothetical protein
MVNSVIRNTLEIFVCCLTSVVNYCLLQIGCYLIIPATALPLATFMILKHRMPATAIITLGIIDDLMGNYHLGTCATLYSVIAYLISISWKNVRDHMRLIYISSGIYIVVNFICFVVFLR